MKEKKKALWTLPKYEAEFTVDDMLSINDYRSAETINLEYNDDVDNVIRSARKCSVSEGRLALMGLQKGLKSIEGEKVKDNVSELLLNHFDADIRLFPYFLVDLYNDMIANTLKKKSSPS